MSRPRPHVLVRRVRFRHALLGGALLTLAGGGIAVAEVDRSQGEIGPSRFLTANGRHLTPEGRLTAVGNFPTGGALSPDGRFYWAVDSGARRRSSSSRTTRRTAPTTSMRTACPAS